MKLYFAGGSSHYIAQFEEVKYILESYYQLKNINLKNWLIEKNCLSKKLFLDSGAFSAHSLNCTININDYCNYLKRYFKFIEVYATLDVIGNWEKTAENTEIMEKQGLTPLPVFHFKSPFSELKRLINKYDYIALGGLVPLALQRHTLQTWLDSCFAHIRDKCKVHGFGVNAFWAWKRYPFFSVDATSWLSGGKFRQIVEFRQKEMKTYRKAQGKPSLNRYKCCVSNYKELDKINIIQYFNMAEYITNLWKKRGISWE